MISPSSEIDRRIFVVGAPRSGTTLVQSLLAAHSDLTSFTESHFFSRHFEVLPLLGTTILTRDPAPRLQEFLLENAGHALSVSAVEITGRPRPAAMLPLYTRSTARRLIAVLDLVARQRGLRAWVEKTPRHLYYLSFLERLLASQARIDFVHVLRRGAEVAASLLVASKGWEIAYDLEQCARRWSDDVEHSWRRSSSPRDHFVFYEDLTTEPAATLDRLLSQLDLAGDPAELLDKYPEAAPALVTTEESWKSNVGEPLRLSTRAQSTLSASQRHQLHQQLRHGPYDRLYERFGVRGTGEASRALR